MQENMIRDAMFCRGSSFTLDGDMGIVLCTWKNDDSTEEIYSLQT
jgi:hypothetical protein